MQIRIAVLVWTIMCVGCASKKLLPDLSIAEKEYLKVHRHSYALDVGVEEYKHPVYSRSLYNSLSHINMFLKVRENAGEVADADIVAVIDEPYTSHPSFPWLVLLSGGVIPQAFYERYGLVFTLYRGMDPADSIHIVFKKDSMSLGGWFAPFLALSKDWVWFSDPCKDRRFYDWLEYELLQHSETLARWETEARHNATESLDGVPSK